MCGCRRASVVCLCLGLALVSGLEAQRAQIPPTVPSVKPGLVESLTIDRAALSALLTVYDAGDYATFDQRAPRFSRSVPNWLLFQGELAAWIAQAPSERRRLVAASVALELAFIEQRETVTAQQLVEIGCVILKEQPPSPAERPWHIAATEITRSHAAHVFIRFGEFAAPHLPAAIDLEVQRAPGLETLFGAGTPPVWLDAAAVEQIAAGGPSQIMSVPGNRRMDRASAEKLMAMAPEVMRQRSSEPNGVVVSIGLWNVADAYRRLVENDPALAEAQLRLGQTYVRLARPAEAVAAFRQADLSAETTYVRYLARLLGGAVFERVGRRAEAILAFRAALTVVPRAQSASLALAPLLFQEGDREEAADLLEEAIKQPVVADPIQNYWNRDPERWWRQFNALRQALR